MGTSIRLLSAYVLLKNKILEIFNADVLPRSCRSYIVVSAGVEPRKGFKALKPDFKTMFNLSLAMFKIPTAVFKGKGGKAIF